MTRLIIADAHVGQIRDDSAVMVALIERAIASGVDQIIYLGDAFQYLIGMEKFWTRAVREVMAAWRGARREGIELAVVEGNRDFFLDEPELAGELDWSGRCLEFVAGSTRYRLLHGDLVNTRDFQYRFWSKVSKSRIARRWARRLPRRLAVSIVRRMEARLATTNRKFRYAKPIDDLRRCAAEAWASDVDILFFGHFHSLWEHRDNHRLALIVPAWLETRQSVLVDDSGEWTFVDETLTPCEPVPKMGQRL